MNKKFQEENYDITREVNTEISKSYSNKNKENYINIYNDENVTATCFSSEAEIKFKNKGLRRINNFISKTFSSNTRDKENKNSKFSDLKARAIWAIVMLLVFGLVIAAGPIYCSLFVIFLISLIFAELIDLNRYRDRNMEIKGYYFNAWFFFFISMYFFNIKVFKTKTSFFERNPITCNIMKKHSMICFLTFCFAILSFLKSLTKGYYRYQFRSFAYIQIIALILSVTCSLIINNISTGVMFFVLPCGMVITNDIAAYIFGRLFGKTKLTELSPKKTVEGFIGAFIVTILYSIIATEFVVRNDTLHNLLCPVNDILTLYPFEFPKCDISRFTNVSFKVYNYNIIALHIDNISVALFTSLLAPMGGFFASGFKRALKIKDFSDTIPGHGGVTDRMDCQILVGIFTYLWLTNFVYSDITKFNAIIKLITQISYDDQVKVMKSLKEILNNQLPNIHN